MRVILAGSPLPGIRATETVRVAQNAWHSVRPADTIDAFPVSDGIPQPFVGSGLDEVLVPGGQQYERGGPGERRFAYVGETSVLMDYTDVLAGLPGPGRLTSAIVGEDLLWIAHSDGPRHVYVALPAAGCVADGGLALLEALSGHHDAPVFDHRQAAPGVSGEDHGDVLDARTPVEANVPRDRVKEWVIRATDAVRTLTITVIAPSEQRLLGLSGLARVWMQEGLPGTDAQKLERHIGDIADTLESAVATVPRTDLLGATPSSRDVYSGSGGIGLALSVIGARIYPAGDITVRPRIRECVSQADLIVYICGTIGEDLPSGLTTATGEAANVGCAVVVIYETGSLRKGELPNLGIHGAYELIPGFDRQETFPTSETTIAHTLDTMVRRVAHTWGWD